MLLLIAALYTLTMVAFAMLYAGLVRTPKQFSLYKIYSHFNLYEKCNFLKLKK